MKGSDNILSIKLVKNGDKLIYLNKGMQAIHKEYIKSLEDGQIVEVYFEGQSDNGTKLQLAKIHTCIRKLASEIGMTFEEMKLEIKKKSGLVVDGEAKSLGDCSIEELNMVIQAIFEAGDFVGINFRGKIPESL
jgi:hypothetical protein